MPVSSAQPMVLAALTPTRGQQGLALFAALLLTVTFLFAMIFAGIHLPVIPTFIPIVVTITVINDVITAALLFAQFSVVRSRALLALACGYLLTGLLLIPYALTFPLTFSQTGLLGAGTQTAAWLWMAWILARPTTVIVYAMLKPGTAAKPQLPTSRSPRRAIVLSVLAAVCGVLAWTWITTAHENLLPVIMLDATRPAPFWRSTWGPAIVVMNVAALTILWFRRQSVLDLWLSVASLSWVLESLLLIFLDVRFSLGWYAARSFWVSSSSFVLLALISETTILYTRLALAAASHAHEREGRLLTITAVAASIAHEVKQPLTAIVSNADAARHLLAGPTPNIAEASAAMNDVSDDGHRVGRVIDSIRAMFEQQSTERPLLDLNELLCHTLSLLRREMESQNIDLELDLDKSLPSFAANRVQLQQALLNLFVNAVDAMNSISDRPRLLTVKSRLHDLHGILITIADSGAGIRPDCVDKIFDVFYTTKPRGTGMGLPLCRSIIESHGGTVRAEPGSPYGTILHVHFLGRVSS